MPHASTYIKYLEWVHEHENEDWDSSGEIENEIGRDFHRYKMSFGKMEIGCSYGDWLHSLRKILKTTWAYPNNKFSVIHELCLWLKRRRRRKKDLPK